MKVVVVVLLLVASCGRLGFDARDDAGSGSGADDAPPVPYMPTWENGTRIRARTLRAVEGGDPARVGWHDTQLDTLCLPALSADGVERCLPNEVSITDKFSDAACTIPVAIALDPACGGTDRYAYSIASPPRYRVFPITGVHTGTVYSTMTGPCIPEGIASFATAYTVGAESPAAMFIETRYENRMINGYVRVVQGFIDGAEDLLIAIGVGGRFCEPTLGRLGDTPCRETQIPSLTPVYSDPACTMPAYLSATPISTAVFDVDTPQLCGTSYQRYLRTGMLGGATHYVKTLEACVATPTGTSSLYQGVLDPVDPFPRGTLAVEPRRGRLGRLSWTSTDGEAVVDLFMFDHERGVPCRPFRGSDQILRCLPAEPHTTRAIADGACSGSDTDLAGSCYTGEALRGPTYWSCRDQGFTVRKYGSAGSSASAVVDGVCKPLDPPPLGIVAVSTLSDVVAPEQFSALVEIIE